MVDPAIVDGQVRGGAAQGIGKALFEEVMYGNGAHHGPGGPCASHIAARSVSDDCRWRASA
ncbi:MAG: hypothetical protein FJ028_02680 [Chloroflexi bacterium]|nr:hypothetical protein [Chloroflexota bacterium]